MSGKGTTKFETFSDQCSRQSADPNKFAENPSSERYPDILKEGADQFGLHPATWRDIYQTLNLF